MKLKLLVILIGMSISMFNLNAQELNYPDTTALKPLDENPIVFPSSEDKNEKLPFAIKDCINRIKQNANNVDQIKFFRETLWRLENAIVNENVTITKIEN